MSRDTDHAAPLQRNASHLDVFHYDPLEQGAPANMSTHRVVSFLSYLSNA